MILVSDIPDILALRVCVTATRCLELKMLFILDLRSEFFTNICMAYFTGYRQRIAFIWQVIHALPKYIMCRITIMVERGYCCLGL
jgi:hypothetical protein